MAARKRRAITGVAKTSLRLTDWQARFILDCLTVDRQIQLAKGHTRRSRGIYAKIAKRVGVTPDMVREIAKRRTFRWLRIRNIHLLSEPHRRRAANGNGD